jgi:hypothetical protein
VRAALGCTSEGANPTKHRARLAGKVGFRLSITINSQSYTFTSLSAGDAAQVDVIAINANGRGPANQAEIGTTSSQESGRVPARKVRAPALASGQKAARERLAMPKPITPAPIRAIVAGSGTLSGSETGKGLGVSSRVHVPLTPQ